MDTDSQHRVGSRREREEVGTEALQVTKMTLMITTADTDPGELPCQCQARGR
jgi:hypothetical protein